MNARRIAIVAIAACASAHAGERPTDGAELFRQMQERKSDFDKYRYLSELSLKDAPQLANTANQLKATLYSFLGRPNDALRAYPFRAAQPFGGLPSHATHQAVPADDWIVQQAKNYRAVMVNEAHHAAQTRLLTLSLLPKLKQAGFTHFAVETLINDGTAPMPAGYPTDHTGFYSREPIFGLILREAVRLGYVLVPYEPVAGSGQTQQQRETGQAETIARIVAEDPKAKVLVHAGYGHIGLAQKGMPGDAKPMAMEFARISGLRVLSVDQASLQPEIAGNGDTGHEKLNAEFSVKRPSVLIGKQDRQAWSSNPKRYNAVVLLPATSADQVRPDWLALDGVRKPVRIQASSCAKALPCLIEARYDNENDDAIPVDQFLALSAQDLDLPLYLLPDHRYRIQLRDKSGATVAQTALDVPAGPY